MEEMPEISKHEIGEALNSIERADDPYFADLEKELMVFLEKSDNPIFRRLYEKEKELKAKGPQKEIRDHIKDWEDFNQNYIIKNIDPENVVMTNYSAKEISKEFVDYLIGRARNILEERDIFDTIVKIKVIKITDKNDGVIMVVESKEGKGMNLFFFGPPEFDLKRAEFTQRIFPD